MTTYNELVCMLANNTFATMLSVVIHFTSNNWKHSLSQIST
jgi:hypothetical protein